MAEPKKIDAECRLARRAFEKWKKRDDVRLWLPRAGRVAWRIWHDAWSEARAAGVGGTDHQTFSQNTPLDHPDA